MKSLFIPLFVVLTAAVQAETYVPASNNIVTIKSGSTLLGEQMVIPVPHIVEKPTEQQVTVPPPLKRLAPRFPPQMEEDASVIIRGQNRSVNDVKEILDRPPSVAGGVVDAGKIPPDLTGGAESEESDFENIAAFQQNSSNPAGSSDSRTDIADPMANGMLFFATLITTIGLVYMAFVAYDYRQRWLQSMTMQNDHYLGAGFYTEAEEPYGSSFSESLGLPHRTSV